MEHIDGWVTGQPKREFMQAKNGKSYVTVQPIVHCHSFLKQVSFNHIFKFQKGISKKTNFLKHILHKFPGTNVLIAFVFVARELKRIPILMPQPDTLNKRNGQRMSNGTG